MIFVTVGTTRFEALIKEVDRLAANTISEPVLCQIGSGDYEPNHCEYFRFKPSIDDLIAQTDLLISHGGTTVLTALTTGVPVIAVANTALADNHQEHYLREIAEHVPLIWTNDPAEIGPLIEQYDRKPGRFDAPSLVPDLSDYLANI